MGIRRVLLRHLEQLLHEAMQPTATSMETAASKAESAAETAMKAAQEAEAAARTAKQSFGVLARELHDIERIDPADRRPGRFIISAVICVLSLIGALVAGSFVPAAFTDPSAREVSEPFGSTNSVQLALASQGRNDPLVTQPPTSQIDIFYGEEEVYYWMGFPARLAGEKFALLLMGTAKLKDVVVEGEGRPDPPPTFHECSETTNSYSSDVPPESCQIIYGTVPSIPPSGALGNISVCLPASQEPLVQVSFVGQGTYTSKIDWAHRKISLPAILGPKLYSTSTESPLIADFAGIQLRDAPYRISDVVGCREFWLEPHRKLGEIISTSSSEDITAAPTEVGSDRITWPDKWTSDDIVAISSRDDEVSIGNILLAVTGALAALAIGLMPIAYDAWRRWRRYKPAAVRATARRTTKPS